MSLYLIQESLRVKLFRIVPDGRIPVEQVNQDSDGAALRNRQPVNDCVTFKFP
jgi:hypothetical protein